MRLIICSAITMCASVRAVLPRLVEEGRLHAERTIGDGFVRFGANVAVFMLWGTPVYPGG